MKFAFSRRYSSQSTFLFSRIYVMNFTRQRRACWVTTYSERIYHQFFSQYARRFATSPSRAMKLSATISSDAYDIISQLISLVIFIMLGRHACSIFRQLLSRRRRLVTVITTDDSLVSAMKSCRSSSADKSVSAHIEAS